MSNPNEWEDEEVITAYEATDMALDALDIAEAMDPVTALISPIIEDAANFVEEIV